MSNMEFTIDAVLAAVREGHGASARIDDELAIPLGRWLKAQRDEVEFSPQGRRVAFQEAVRHVTTRLVIDEHFAKHPEIAAQEVESPVFVVGLYRSGTTKLHRLLCADPRWTYLRTWEVMYPAPLDDVMNGAHDTRRQLAQQRIDRLGSASAGALDAHPMSVDAPEEDWLLMAQTFLVPNIGQHTPVYSRWLEAQDVTPMYRHLHRQLQILQWQQRVADPRPRRFCLKAPVHLEFVDALIDVFPDAQIIFTHRDPAQSVASNCLMMEAYRRKYTDDVDLVALGDEVLHKAALALDNALRVRTSLSTNRFHDVAFSDIVARPLELMPAIYRYVGASPDEETKDALRRGEAEAERNRSAPTHRYGAARYGLSDDQIRERTEAYLDWAREALGADLVQLP